MNWQKARAQSQGQGQKYAASKAEYEAKRLELAEKIAKLESSVAEARADEASSLESATQALSKTNQVARRISNRYVIAPRDGVVMELSKKAPGSLMKKDEKLLTLVPAYESLIVVAQCNPNDIPLLHAQQGAMLAFDGYPMLPIPGWPEHSVGMFEAQVRFVSTAVGPDQTTFPIVLEPAEIWPVGLKAGTTSHATLLLGDVPLWFELWRQLNGFPANRTAPVSK